MTKKFVIITFVLILAVGVAAYASPFHAENEFATVTDLSLQPSLQNTLRLGVQGKYYSLDVAMLFADGSIQGAGPSFSLDYAGFTLQLDGYLWTEMGTSQKFAQVSMKYEIMKNVNFGGLVKSNRYLDYEFGLFWGIEI